MPDIPSHATRERHIQNEILRTFGTRADMRLWRQNTGAATFRGQRVSFGVPGAADISGLLNDGRRIEIEVKSAVGRQSPDQKNYQAMIERFNGIYILARSVADVAEALRGAGYANGY